MPWAPKRACPRCHRLIGPGPCPDCERTRKARLDAQRGSDRWFYATPEWRELRAQVLLEEPICRAGCDQPSTVVDHILSRRERPDLALVRMNCRAFCKRHHDQRTAREQGFAR